MSHGLHPERKLKHKPSGTRTVHYRFFGNWSAEDERLLQKAMNEGVTSQVEMCRDGLWLNGPPGPELRSLCAELERRGLRREPHS